VLRILTLLHKFLKMGHFFSQFCVFGRKFLDKKDFLRHVGARLPPPTTPLIDWLSLSKLNFTY